MTTEELYELVSKVQGGQINQQTLADSLSGRRAKLDGAVVEVRDDGSNVIVLTGHEAARHFSPCMLKLVDKQDASGVSVGQTISFTGTIGGFFLGSVLINEAKVEKVGPSPESRVAQLNWLRKDGQLKRKDGQLKRKDGQLKRKDGQLNRNHRHLCRSSKTLSQPKDLRKRSSSFSTVPAAITMWTWLLISGCRADARIP